MIKSLSGMFQFKSIRTRLTLWFLILSLVPVILTWIMVYRQMEQSQKASILEKLEAVRDLKVKEVNNWLDERTGAVRMIAADNEIRKLEEIHAEGKDNNNEDPPIIAEARSHLMRYLENFNSFHEIFIIDPHSGRIVISTDENNEGNDRLKDRYLSAVLNAGDLFIGDIYYSESEKQSSMLISMPIFGMNDDRHLAGILIARIDLGRSLYELLLDRVGMGESGETLIVNRDMVALNELRWYRNAPFKLKIRAKAAVEASLGHTGIEETADYRGEPVLSAYTYIPRTGWGFVAKQDIREIYAPIRKFKDWMLVLGMLSVIAVIISAFRISRSISGPIEALNEGSEIIGRGDLDHKVGNSRQDEIGRLSRAFDQMIRNIKNITASRDELNKEIAGRRQLEKTILEIEDRERRHIGHDLHDDLGQQLSGISFMSQCLENYLKENSVTGAEKASRITELIDRAKEQVKDLARGLSPMILKGEEGLMTSLAELAGNTSRIFNVPCEFRHDGPVSVRNEAAVIHLYRIAQEAVTNAVKHSAPGSVEIGIRRTGNEIVLTIRDDGKGITETEDKRRGMGLQVMNYRAGMIGASLDILSNSSGGTLVTCIFPDTTEDLTGTQEVNRTDESLLQNI